MLLSREEQTNFGQAWNTCIAPRTLFPSMQSALPQFPFYQYLIEFQIHENRGSLVPAKGYFPLVFLHRKSVGAVKTMKSQAAPFRFARLPEISPEWDKLGYSKTQVMLKKASVSCAVEFGNSHIFNPSASLGKITLLPRCIIRYKGEV